jgi:transposase
MKKHNQALHRLRCRAVADRTRLNNQVRGLLRNVHEIT